MKNQNKEKIEERVKEILSEMTLEEKIRQMSGSASLLDLLIMLVRYNWTTSNSGENRRLGIPPMKFTDGPRGVALGNSTCFPVSMARGATWDKTLEERIGSVMGIEARAQGANYFGGVCINLLRHPGWGRAQETFGEDQHLLGIMGTSMIAGLQKHVMACAKHFACNSIEKSRFYVNVSIDERTLREVYLPHFKKCVDAGVASIMSAYNRVNGKYCGHNSHLLRDILKDDWGFEGFVISDFFFGLYNGEAGAKGGLDIEMPNTRHYGRKLKKLVRQGKVSEELIDDAVTRILRQKLKFSNVGDPAGYSKDKVACQEHTELALEAAHKSIVLLKNENAALPLSRQVIKKIAVIGELAGKVNIGDLGSSRVRPPYTVTPLEGIKNRAGNSIEVIYYGGNDLAKTGRIAKDTDAVIVVAGLTRKHEGEYLPFTGLGGDREDLSLPQDQIKLINQAAGQASSCIVVLEGGSAITMEEWKDKVDAILMAWYPGMEGGNAIADLLFGDINPSGKLPVTFPRSSNQLVYFNKKDKNIDYGYHHGYRHIDREGLEPAFPFGFGLSYAQYKYSNLTLSEKEFGNKDGIKVSVEVTNTGDVAGEEIVQLYIGYKGSEVERPIKDLKAFGRIALEPGETGTLCLEMEASNLAYYDTGSSTWKVEEIEYTVYVGSSSREEDLHLSDTFRIKEK